MPTHSAIVRGFGEQVAIRPEAPALFWRDGEVSYGELDELVHLARKVVDEAPAGPVGVRAVKSPGAIALVLACLGAGREFLLLSPELPVADQAALFANAGCVEVLTAGSGVADFGYVARTDMDFVPSGEALAAHSASDGEPISFMLTTSGSTGLPKIVPLAVGAVDRFTAWAHERFGLGTGRTVLNFAPLNFDLCLLDVWATLRYGGRVVLVDAQSAGRAGVLRRLLADTQPHVVQAVPLLFELLISLEERDPLLGTQHVISTGEAIRAACLAELPGLFPNARIYNLYGCTETNDSFLHEFPSPGAAASEIPLGEPLPGVRARLVDEHGDVVDGPGVGELVVHTPFQTPGYLAQEEVSDATGGAASSAVAKFAPYDGIPHFRSGDLVERKPDGTLVLLGRNDFQVKVRGQRVNTEEVERVLRAHPDVLQAAVVAVPDPFSGRRLHGLVRHRAGEPPSTLALRRHCAEHLLPAAVPVSLRLTDEPLPATGTGKIDRARIRRAEMGEHRA